MAVRFLPINSRVLFLIVLLILACSINSIQGIQDDGCQSADNEFIRASCKSTTYPALCYSSLSKYASSIKTSQRLLAKTALLVTHDAAKNASSFLSKLSQNSKMRSGEIGPMKDCLELLSDAIEELGKSVVEMDQIKDHKSGFQFHMSNIQTWVSAAMTDESTCSEGFVGKTVNKKVKTMVNKKMEDLEERTSNALCLINSYASYH